jgi:hypothetical protein
MALIKIAPYNAPSNWQRDFILPGSQDYNLINQYLVSGNTVELGPGTVVGSDGMIRPKASSKLLGQGVSTTINGGIFVASLSNIELGQFTMAGAILSSFAGGIFTAIDGANVSGLYYHDIISSMKLGWGDFYFYVNGAYSLSNVICSRLFAESPDGFGFLLSGEKAGNIIQDFTFYRCGSHNAALGPNRMMSGDGNCWVAGFDFCEFGASINPLIYRVTAIKCTSDGSWEAANHFEITPNKRYVVLLDCAGTNAGKKIGTAYGTGFLMSIDTTKNPSDDAIVSGLTGGGNTLGDMMVYNGTTDTFDKKYTPPIDLVIGSTRIQTRISQGNCTGIAVWNSTYWDVYIYSSDQNPVNQTITLPDGTQLPVSFTDFLIQRNIIPQPSGFIAGSSHTATFQITVVPANLSYSVELWLGINTSTKAATSGKIPMISTGSAQNVAATITMPTGGTYNVYIDLYYGTTKFASFVSTTALVISGTITEPVWT